jgi:protein tyrosine phosphatase
MEKAGPRDGNHAFVTNEPDVRYAMVPTAAHTQVYAPDDRSLPANRLGVDGRFFAIAGQYPTDAEVASHCRALAQMRTPVLVVLASTDDFDHAKLGRKPLPPYFQSSGIYDGVDVAVTKGEKETVGGSLELQAYSMRVKHQEAGREVSVDIPVRHVLNWPDRSALKVDVLDALAQKIAEVSDKRIEGYQRAGSRALQDRDNKLLPWIHCLAGSGRSGLLAGALYMHTHGTASALSVETIATDLRKTRNYLTLQTQEQLKTLAELGAKKRLPILNDYQT